MIDYNDIINIFDKNDWDFSYIKSDEYWEIINQPTKLGNNIEHIVKLKEPIPNENSILLVCIKKTQDFDYTFLPKFIQDCKKAIPTINISEFHCNYKYAAVKAGLGQYAKNSLFYHSKFQFDTHIGVFLIRNEIKNLPSRNPANFKLLSLCNGCNDCINACPVNAIHYENNKTWINIYDCDNFCSFGNHPEIPSLKWNWFTLDDKKSQYFNNFEKIYNIKNYYDLLQITNEINSRPIIIDGKKYDVIFPICRECTSQRKCTKYNGSYPYDWTKVSIKE